ncbi:rod shape-determining protein MreB [Vibrio parahaemolyticus]|uniref:rod shape-determining protein n=1 Tax=Vibrio parahaemolyticus TaxID=670 RepID=UPI00288E5E2C|nr:rod shape-determining protein MreB [Vibrio parahaemolyticus]EJC7027187.1 rod shape-determining protein MreB [Vibrio parahaemolyticus]EJC7177683.1 rod shape-determining protein MreB [Vibrio parahaemolyticus]EJF4098959.1 rod shape-determining protein MreB [Vibrio parahaemolyticus]EJX1286169.1 rod shape-determining protein MreB [Vibrio parahaemolyticus]
MRYSHLSKALCYKEEIIDFLLWLRGKYSEDILIELSSKNILVQVFGTDRKYEFQPYIAIETLEKSKKILSIGTSAEALGSSNVEVVNPFKHSRTFVHDVLVGEKVLQHGIAQVHDNTVLKPSPRVVLHIKEKSEGGLSKVEQNLAEQLLLGAGARDFVLHTGSRIDVFGENFDSLKK